MVQSIPGVVTMDQQKNNKNSSQTLSSKFIRQNVDLRP